MIKLPERISRSALRCFFFCLKKYNKKSHTKKFLIISNKFERDALCDLFYQPRFHIYAATVPLPPRFLSVKDENPPIIVPRLIPMTATNPASSFLL